MLIRSCTFTDNAQRLRLGYEMQPSSRLKWKSGLNTYLCSSSSQLAPCVTDRNKDLGCFNQTAILSFSVFKLKPKPTLQACLCTPHPLPWMNRSFTQQYSKRTSPMITFAFLTRTHSGGNAIVTQEGTEKGLIDDGCKYHFFLFAPLSYDRSQRSAVVFIFCIQQLHSIFPL